MVTSTIILPRAFLLKTPSPRWWFSSWVWWPRSRSCSRKGEGRNADSRVQGKVERRGEPTTLASPLLSSPTEVCDVPLVYCDMDNIRAMDLAKDLMLKHGITHKGWVFDWDLAMRRFGFCSYREKKVSLSWELVKKNPEEQVKDTILHEIAHALVGPRHGHDGVWRAMCTQIGATPERCYNSQVARPELPLIRFCTNCGKEHQVSRRSRRAPSCGRCSGGIYNPAFVLQYRRNPDYNPLP